MPHELRLVVEVNHYSGKLPVKIGKENVASIKGKRENRLRECKVVSCHRYELLSTVRCEVIHARHKISSAPS